MGFRVIENKDSILSLVSSALKSGTITKNDLLSVIDKSTPTAKNKPEGSRVTAVDIMYYIAGIVLFAAIIALIAQSWDSGVGARVILSAGAGTLLWAVAIYLMRFTGKNDIRSGITNSLLLSGSLSLIAGGFIIANELFDFDNPNYYAMAGTLLTLGILHITFGWQIKRDLLVLLGVLLAVGAFPTVIFGLLDGSDVPVFINSLVVAVSGGLLAYATRVVSWVGASSTKAARAFDSLSAFTVLMSLYSASYDEGTGVLWLLVLIIGVIGMFYLSIVLQDKLMLGNGSLFLVITVITLSVRYFSGYGVATSLFIGAIGLIGTAITATTINRRYIK